MSRDNVDTNFESRLNKTLQTKGKEISKNEFNLIHYLTSLYGNAMSAKGLNLIDPIYANMFYYNKMRSLPLTDIPYVTRTYAFFTRPELNFSEENINSIPFFKWLYDKPIGKMVMSMLTDPEYFIGAPAFINKDQKFASKLRDLVARLSDEETTKITNTNESAMADAYSGSDAASSAETATQSSKNEQQDDQEAVNELNDLEFSSITDDAAVDNLIANVNAQDKAKNLYKDFEDKTSGIYEAIYKQITQEGLDVPDAKFFKAKDVLRTTHNDTYDKFNFTSPFIPLLMNTCTSVTGAKDFSLGTYEYEEDEFSVKQNVATGMDDLWSPGTLTVSHNDIAYGPVSLLYMLWVFYIHYVSRGYIMTTRDHVLERILDYTCSIYVFVIGADGRTIERFGKYTGCYPTSFPFAQQLEHNQEIDPTMLQKIQITFQYNRFEPMNPEILTDFNFVSETEWLFKLKNWDSLYDRTSTLKEAGLFTVQNREQLSARDIARTHAAGRSALIWDTVKNPGMSGKVPRALINGTDVPGMKDFSNSDVMNNMWGGYPTILNSKELVWVMPQWTDMDKDKEIKEGPPSNKQET